ncbi:MAG: hypothetical protein JSV44_08345 [Candidatus Zixiibacteriota bacterium]|nr:MAG: hypothetical protein JSV44_08345 [candidate division Zixibacteria bacterium]
MDYGKLVNQSFEISWKYKSLWILGFFASVSFFTGGLENHLKDRTWPTLSDIHIAIIILAVLTMAIIALFLFIMHLISVAGLIDGVFRVERGDGYRLRQLFKTGATHFWRFLGLFFIFFLITGSCIVFLVGGVVLAFVFLELVGFLVLLVAIPVGLGVIFFFGNMYSLTQREIVASKISLFDAISEAYQLLTKNLGSNILIFLITAFLGIAIFLISVLLMAAFAIPTLIIATMSLTALIIMLFVSIPVFIGIMVVVEGLLGTFLNSLFTLFYLELRKLTPRQPLPAPGTGPVPGQS